MKNKISVKKLLLCSIAVFLAGMMLASLISTSGGKVELRRLSVMTDRGVAISLEVYKPKTATRDNPAPVVMLIPGGNAAVENMSDAGMELARRGMVAIGIEPYTIGRSDVELDNEGLGSIDVTDYVYNLDFIDNTNVGYIGWSMGASRVNASLYVPDPNGEMTVDANGNETVKNVIRDGVKGVMYVGAGGLISSEYQINSALFEGEWDNLYRGDRRQMSSDPNYTAPLADYGVTANEGIVVEGDREHYAFQAPFALMPDMNSSDITDSLMEEHYFPIMPLSLGLTVGEAPSGATVTSLLTTSDTAFSKVAGYEMSTYEKEDGDIDGPFSLAVSVDVSDSGGRMVWFASSSFLDDTYNAYSSGANVNLGMNALSSLIGESEAMAIRSKSLNYNYLTISDSTSSLLKVMMIGVFPLVYLGIGIGVVIRRRRLQNEPV